jgi:hypothetical protein
MAHKGYLIPHRWMSNSFTSTDGAYIILFEKGFWESIKT